MKQSKLKIPAEFTAGMTQEERIEFVNSWTNATWLTEKLKKAINSKIEYLIEDLIEPESSSDILQTRADIRAYRTLMRMLP